MENHLAGNIEKTPAAEAPGKDFEITKCGQSVVHAAGSDVAQVESQKKNFWHQLKGSIDFGYDFTSGNSQTSLTSDGECLVPFHQLGSRGIVYFVVQRSGPTPRKTNLLELQMTSGPLSEQKTLFFLASAIFFTARSRDLNLRNDHRLAVMADIG